MKELGVVAELVLRSPKDLRCLFLGKARALKTEDTKILRVHECKDLCKLFPCKTVDIQGSDDEAKSEMTMMSCIHKRR